MSRAGPWGAACPFRRVLCSEPERSGLLGVDWGPGQHGSLCKTVSPAAVLLPRSAGGSKLLIILPSASPGHLTLPNSRVNGSRKRLAEAHVRSGQWSSGAWLAPGSR